MNLFFFWIWILKSITFFKGDVIVETNFSIIVKVWQQEENMLFKLNTFRNYQFMTCPKLLSILCHELK